MITGEGIPFESDLHLAVHENLSASPGNLSEGSVPYTQASATVPHQPGMQSWWSDEHYTPQPLQSLQDLEERMNRSYRREGDAELDQFWERHLMDQETEPERRRLDQQQRTIPVNAQEIQYLNGGNRPMPDEYILWGRPLEHANENPTKRGGSTPITTPLVREAPNRTDRTPGGGGGGGGWGGDDSEGVAGDLMPHNASLMEHTAETWNALTPNERVAQAFGALVKDVPAGETVRDQGPLHKLADEIHTTTREGEPMTSILFGEDRHILWPERVVRSIWNGLTLPGDIATGESRMSDPETTERVLDLAGTITFGTMPLRATRTAVDAIPASPGSIPTRGVGPIEQAGVDTYNALLGNIETGRASAPGSLERLGVRTYDRELGRQPSGRFGTVPEEMSRGRGGPAYIARNPENDITWSPTDQRSVPSGWQSVEGGAALRAGIEPSTTPIVVGKIGESSLEKTAQNVHQSRFAGHTNIVSEFTYTPTTGEPVYIHASYYGERRDIYINGIESQSYRPMTQGTTETRRLLRLLQQAFPEAETITGFRVSGARGEAGHSAKASMRLPRKQVAE